MIRARLLEHVVELATSASRGASRSLAVWGGYRLLSLPPPLLFLGGGVGLDVAALSGRIVLALARLVVEDGTNRFFAGGEVGGSVEQLVGVNGSASRELMHQIPARRTLEESVNDLDVGDAGELGALLGEAPHVVTQGLTGLLTTPFEVPGVPRAHVSALEVSHEDLDQVIPVADLVRGEVLEPCPRRVCEVQRKIANDPEVIHRAA